MQVIGASAVCAEPVTKLLEASAFQGRACLVFCDGDDLTGIFAEEGETTADLIRVAAKVVPEVAA